MITSLGVLYIKKTPSLLAVVFFVYFEYYFFPLRHRSLQCKTSSKLFFHFLRIVNTFPHTLQSFACLYCHLSSIFFMSLCYLFEMMIFFFKFTIGYIFSVYSYICCFYLSERDDISTRYLTRKGIIIHKKISSNS